MEYVCCSDTYHCTSQHPVLLSHISISVNHSPQVRIIFRLVEYARGTDPSNPIPYNEAYIYGFDAAPMALAILLLNIFHPGRVLKGPDSEFTKMSKHARREEERVRKLERGGQAAGYKNGQHGGHTRYREDIAMRGYGYEGQGRDQRGMEWGVERGNGYNGRAGRGRGNGGW